MVSAERHHTLNQTPVGSEQRHSRQGIAHTAIMAEWKLNISVLQTDVFSMSLLSISVNP